MSLVLADVDSNKLLGIPTKPYKRGIEAKANEPIKISFTDRLARKMDEVLFGDADFTKVICEEIKYQRINN